MNNVYLYSPFCPETACKGQGPVLLLQLILSELAIAKTRLKETAPISIYPFEWSNEVGGFNKVKEHVSLLKFAFPDLEKEVEALQKVLKHSCLKIFKSLIPFILPHLENENLMYFLIKNSKNFNLKLLGLDKEKLNAMKKSVETKYGKRGFLLTLSKA